MSKVYGYCRVAFKSETEMVQQCKMISDYCKDNGLQIDEFFCDNGVSGLKMERSALQRMLNILQQGDVVIIKDVARLTRNMHQYMILVRQIYKAGATLVVMDQPDLKFNVD